MASSRLASVAVAAALMCAVTVQGLRRAERAPEAEGASEADRDPEPAMNDLFAEAGVPPEELLALPKQAPEAKAAGLTAQAPSTRVINWTYFPPSPRLGIVTGGSPHEFADGNFASKTAIIFLKYAKRKGYALYVDKDIARHSTRHQNWNKLHIMHQLIDDVPLLVWMDTDIVLTRLDVSLEVLLRQAACKGANQGRWEQFFSKEANDDTFLWMSADTRNGGFDQYSVNAAPGMMALRSGPLAKEFLEKVWHVGDQPLYFLHHKAAAREGDEGEWPYEQGAVWDVLAGNPSRYMARTCLPPVGYLQSVTNRAWVPEMFARHCSEQTDKGRNRTAALHLWKLGGTTDI